MGDRFMMVLSFVEISPVLAPIMFILFHIIRQFLFIPVAIVCIAGGILFGSLLGMVYSMIGLTLVCSSFYFTIARMPKMKQKLLQIKNKFLGPYAKLTVGQIAILRLIPFIHFQLLNLCLLERKPNFRDYIKSSIITNIPLVFFYTVFGEFISKFSPSIMIMILLALSVLFFILREKVTVMKWKEFFPEN
ncbi:TVP38/TMEM64 family protein [Bacillus ginsengihumi]|uniref:TVP38/TMEM64 family membrane protein n=2 Tax=Heyndrickxia ginsengihumi TaxID=363870 RepID=A0A0A6VK30_9BACI|nr:VTT domain-containing protein [Heyndrickxia ginsengihumi]KHD86964.1 alkaline phosphatase [Heyndrickxia ginsengihumi]MBE6182700.1 TVP38/TMEM64 family protein [Bacillus sp. (in: firmicutes)]MCM3021987.1 VTT domain-containing protein [Heyndrickxia ginsengihumi]NEY20902.1 TVP38/TMEM64 family protein [Heyndrickxia ginsengihumi]